MFTIVPAKTADVEVAREAVPEVHERKTFDHDAVVKFLSDPANYLFLALESETRRGQPVRLLADASSHARAAIPALRNRRPRAEPPAPSKSG
jgi:hypothetical protein